MTVPANMDVEIGNSYTYICLKGYRTTEPLTTTCNENLTWSNPPPKCGETLLYIIQLKSQAAFRVS